jgi:XRE family transcriptional regulator, fatty acid utilization regulator
MDSTIIRKRFRTLREECAWSQEDLAVRMGFNDRQTVSQIENGDRKITAEELVKAAAAFRVDLEFFVDPFRLYGEANFSWRQKNVSPIKLKDFEEKSGQIIGLYRWLLNEKGTPTPVLSQKLFLDAQSSLDDAATAGEGLAWQLKGDEVAPALALQRYVEDQLGMLILNVDAVSGISGAACRLPQVNTILINRNEIEGRRHFDIAHELFHLLTWDTMPPRYLDSDEPTGPNDKRIEKLADSFAASILMPTWALMPYLHEKKGAEIHSWLNTIANNLHVTAVALKFRLRNMGAITKAEFDSISDSQLKFNGSVIAPKGKLPPIFSPHFMALLSWGLEDGRISVRRAASLLGMTINQFSQAFTEHAIEAPFEL